MNIPHNNKLRFGNGCPFHKMYSLQYKPLLGWGQSSGWSEIKKFTFQRKWQRRTNFCKAKFYLLFLLKSLPPNKDNTHYRMKAKTNLSGLAIWSNCWFQPPPIYIPQLWTLVTVHFFRESIQPRVACQGHHFTLEQVLLLLPSQQSGFERKLNAEMLERVWLWHRLDGVAFSNQFHLKRCLVFSRDFRWVHQIRFVSRRLSSFLLFSISSCNSFVWPLRNTKDAEWVKEWCSFAVERKRKKQSRISSEIIDWMWRFHWLRR